MNINSIMLKPYWTRKLNGELNIFHNKVKVENITSATNGCLDITAILTP